MNQIRYIISLAIIWLASSAPVYAKRIITLSGALTETVCALGHAAEIVAVDVTSNYPASIAKLPKVSKDRAVSAEGIISFNPSLVLAPENAISKAGE